MASQRLFFVAAGFAGGYSLAKIQANRPPQPLSTINPKTTSSEFNPPKGATGPGVKSNPYHPVTGDHSGNAAEALKSDGSIGKQFNSAGAIGGLAEKVGGPFAHDGAIGKHFEDTGAVGGAVQNVAEKLQSNSTNNQTHDKTEHSKVPDFLTAAINKVNGKADDAEYTAEKKAKDAAGAFKSDGAVGKEFNETGAIGGLAQKIGGPFASDGAIGKHFTDTGAVGGTVHEKAKEAEGKSFLTNALDAVSGKVDEAKHSVSKKDSKDAAGAFKSDGAVGKEFNETGAIGGLAQKIGGPFASDGAIGKHFTDTGAVGGTVHEKAKEAEGKGFLSSALDAVSGKADEAGHVSNKKAKDAAGAFKSDGAVGKEFNETGAVGGLAQKIGGPFSSDGAIGKHFTDTGAVGGKVQEKAEEKSGEKGKIHEKNGEKGSSSTSAVSETLGKAAEAFKSDGVIGKQFNSAGAIGGLAQKVGGPFAKDGAIGKEFEDTGAVGGSVQKNAEKVQSKETEEQTHKKR